MRRAGLILAAAALGLLALELALGRCSARGGSGIPPTVVAAVALPTAENLPVTRSLGPTDVPTLALAVPSDPAILEPTVTPEVTRLPAITRFGLSHIPESNAPEFVPLDWDVLAADSIRLEQSPGGSDRLHDPQQMEVQDYTLVASDGPARTTRSFRLYVLRPPTIDDFQVQSTQVGDVTRLTWQTDRATRVYIDGQLLEGSGGIIEVPSSTDHEYVLRAENAVGFDMRTVHVAVAPSPSPTETPTEDPTQTPTDTPSPTPPPTDTPTPTPTPPLTDTPTPTPPPTDTPTATSPPMQTLSATPTPSETRGPTRVVPPGACPGLSSPTLDATQSGSGAVTLHWSTIGGCSPLQGTITANYTYASFTRDFAVSDAAGALVDQPPSVHCAGMIAYELDLHDAGGHAARASTNLTVHGTCPPPPAAQTSSVPASPALTIAGARSPSPNANGWNNTDVTITFSCSGGAGGIASCGPSPQVVSTEGANQSRKGVATDHSGATASTSVQGINIDKTPPVLHLPSIIVFRLPAGRRAAAAPVNYRASATDNLDSSPKFSCDHPSGSDFPVGQTTVHCQASDKAGNVTRGTFFVRVDLPPLPTPDSTSTTPINPP
jgi:hypothetical protein